MLLLALAAVGEGVEVEIGGGGFTLLLLVVLALSAGRGAAAAVLVAPLVLLICSSGVSTSGLLLPSRPRDPVSQGGLEALVLGLRSAGGMLDVVVSPKLFGSGKAL